MPNPQKVTAGGLLSLLGMGIVVVWMLNRCTGSDSASPPATASTTFAEVVCERAIRSRLHDPKSAEFERISAFTASGGNVHVYLTVRARNGFGGMRAGTGSCTVTPSGAAQDVVVNV